MIGNISMNKAIYKVFVVGGDIGGMKETHLGMQALAKRGVASLSYFIDGAANAKAGTEYLAKQHPSVLYETRGPISMDAPDVVVVATSATASGAQIEWTRWAHDQKIPVVWIEDLWGTGEHPSVGGGGQPQ